MDWTSLIPLAGVILGAGITYCVQSKILEKQRELDLDNQKREWKRKKIETTLEQYGNLVLLSTTFKTIPRTRESLDDLEHKIVSELVQVNYLGDEQIKIIAKSFGDKLASAYEYLYSQPEGPLSEDARKELDKIPADLMGILRDLKNLINLQTESTYE